MTEIEYKESKRHPGYYTAYRHGQACGFVSKEQMEINEVYHRRKAGKVAATVFEALQEASEKGPENVVIIS